MHPEIRNLGLLLKHLGKCALGGRLREAATVGGVVLMRLVETATEPFGSGHVTCDFCGWTGRRFRTYVTGGHARRNALCPRCLSLERHRDFIRMFRALRPMLPARIRVLDIAPTQAFADYCSKASDIEYLSVDKVSPIAMKHMDVQHLELSSDTFDVVVCCHVLDYVPDDIQGLREIKRVLKAQGVAVLQEGIAEGQPSEEWGRPRADQQHRIRQYGSDFRERVQTAGFRFVESAQPAGIIFFASKDSGPQFDRFESQIRSELAGGSAGSPAHPASNL